MGGRKILLGISTTRRKGVKIEVESQSLSPGGKVLQQSEKKTNSQIHGDNRNPAFSPQVEKKVGNMSKVEGEDS